MRPMNLPDDAVTADKMLLAAARVGLYGLNIYVSPHIYPVPKIQLSPDFKWCTDAFRESFNKSLLDDYGTKEVAYFMPSKGVFASPSMYARLELRN